MLELAPFLAVRVKANAAAIEDSEAYEAFTCLVAGTNTVERDESGKVVYGWKRGSFALSPKNERALMAAGELREEEALYQPHDVATGQLMELRAGSVYWNGYRERWIMIAEQLGPQGFTGEIYYLESATPVGPWRQARKIASHAPHSFYNPTQLPFFDQAGGRIIYFIGTFLSPSGSARVPRYEFNQLVYRLDLANVKRDAP
jgi:hypothetical protein